ncbi:MAG: hypothetical protein KGM24_06215 [Elusimicrobia bacterium]|nr:hypothetical protein [Elusimicrobiota bacterium]
MSRPSRLLALLLAASALPAAALGVDAADWKHGLVGGSGDEYLENFAIDRRTGEVVCFDCLVRW